MNNEANKCNYHKIKINTESLSKLAIYLSGLKDGKGNLLPLGTIVLDDLWNAISYLRGDGRYEAERDILLGVYESEQDKLLGGEK